MHHASASTNWWVDSARSKQRKFYAVQVRISRSERAQVRASVVIWTCTLGGAPTTIRLGDFHSEKTRRVISRTEFTLPPWHHNPFASLTFVTISCVSDSLADGHSLAGCWSGIFGAIHPMDSASSKKGSTPSWTQRFTHSRKYFWYARRSRVADICEVGRRIWCVYDQIFKYRTKRLFQLI